MRIAIIGRTELLFNVIELLLAKGHTISCVLTAKESPEYTKSAEDFRDLAERINVPFRSSAKIKEHLDFFSNAEIDIAVSVNYPNVIPAEVVNLFPLGILNVHGGDLPRYRGNACQAWAIINGENHIALCVHKMKGGELDSGDIILKKYYSININTRIGEVYNWFETDTPHMVLNAIEALQLPGFEPEVQSLYVEDALRCYPRIPEDGRIHWTKNCEDIVRLINASSEPYSGAFCGYNGEKLIIWRAEVFEEEEKYLAIPGQIARIIYEDGSIIVICGNGKIRVREVEFSQAGRVFPAQFIKSIRSRLI
jgi:UDP-4-amino-4-deoxy-L-arabinose formyltransferase/UDP-glucuronic acid dehydrogenase (UDP-4-keto-hexauronic acid decarboxylating)